MFEKLIFCLQIFFLGFGVVMAVLFVLYGLILLYNRFSAPNEKKETQPPPGGTGEKHLSPQLKAAIAAALSCYTGTVELKDGGAAFGAGGRGASTAQHSRPEIEGSQWAAAGRRDLLESSTHLEFSRRKRT